MKLKPSLNAKSFQMDKTQSTILGIIVAATVISVFCLTSAKVLLGQAFYQQRVIKARNDSVKQLNTDVTDAKTLSSQYNTVFLGTDPQNIIGGSATAGDNATPPDGNNGKIRIKIAFY